MNLHTTNPKNMQTKEEIQKKVDYLNSIGLPVDHNDDEMVYFDNDFYSCGIELENFDVGDSVEQIMNYADIYSCCGDVLDKDWMLCPTCKEHC